MIELFKAGGPLMYALLAAALAGIAVIFERIVVLQSVPSSQKADKQLETLENALNEGEFFTGSFSDNPASAVITRD